jgi:exo-beta-1,3-glucanase (GH17 family)/beta-glucanase (GH16 family)
MRAQLLVAVLFAISQVACNSGSSNGGAGQDNTMAGKTTALTEVAQLHHQGVEDLIAGETMGVAYSGFREGQHPDRGQGAVNPSRSEISEDLDILLANDLTLLRLYDSGENSATVLQLIRERKLPFKVMLGIWLKAEVSNHEGCPWLLEPIPGEELAANTLENAAEIQRGIRLANDYPDIVVAVNVGNEALVDWNDHMVSVDSVISYVHQVKAATEQAVTVADNYEWWINEGAPLAAAVDFIGVHTYPLWEYKSIDEALAYTIDNVEAVRAALPGKPLHVLEAGWATEAIEFEEEANERNQQRHYQELRQWARASNTTVFFFEAFDEPWKGETAEPRGAEKHWGLFNVDRTPKLAISEDKDILYDIDAVVWAVNVGGDEHVSVDGVHYRADEMISGGEPGKIDRVIGAQDGAIYESFRTGDFRIRRAMQNGLYDITFHFAEPDDVDPGERVFDVSAQGRTVIETLDVRRERDNNFRAALSRTVSNVVVGNGQLELDFSAHEGAPLLNALVVRAQRPAPQAWEQVWTDEFDYDGPPDPQLWNVEVWDARKVNDEDQAYTDRGKNVRVVDGKLVLEAHREDYGDARYTSARVQSHDKGDLFYGRVDFRARLPAGRGAWPALWMMPSDPYRYATACGEDEEWHGGEACDAWPNSGEIDIMEHVGYDNRRIHGTVHNRAFYHGNGQQRKGSIEVRNVDNAFHLYSLEWTPERIDIYMDGTPYFSYINEHTGWEAWPFDHPFHLIMNLAVGGTWGRAGGPVDDSIFPIRLEVDYVRVFKAVASSRD